MQTLSALLAACSDRPATALRVMQGNGKMAMDAGSADQYYWRENGPGGVDQMQVGESQGECDDRGASDWWPVYLDGEQVAELRDDACGMTLHTTV